MIYCLKIDIKGKKWSFIDVSFWQFFFFKKRSSAKSHFDLKVKVKEKLIFTIITVLTIFQLINKL